MKTYMKYYAVIKGHVEEFCFLRFFFGHPVVYGDPQARDQIQAAVVTCTTTVTMLDPFNPLSEARGGTCVLMDTSQIRFR